MRIKIFIDNNAWDVFFNLNLDLAFELPENEFELYITGEGEFEIPGMPKEKREYVESYINTGFVKTDSYFGFIDDSLPPDEQRTKGFSSLENPESGGRFISLDEYQFINSENIGTKKRPTGLYKNEADVSLAARSLNAVVLTCDEKKALKRVRKKHRGTVVDLKKYTKDSNLGSFIKNEICKLEQKG